MCFSKSPSSINLNNMLFMKDGSSIDHVQECKHLGNLLLSDISCTNIESAINDLFMRTNSLMCDLSIANSRTLSQLHNSFCMSIFGSQLWLYYKHKKLEPLFIA